MTNSEREAARRPTVSSAERAVYRIAVGVAFMVGYVSPLWLVALSVAMSCLNALHLWLSGDDDG
jgi:hypothetical protein